MHSQHRPRRSLQCWAGRGNSNAVPSPHTPLPGSTGRNQKVLTDADHSWIFMKQASVASLDVDRHHPGIVIGIGFRS